MLHTDDTDIAQRRGQYVQISRNIEKKVTKFTFHWNKLGH